jgi:hypothetical protein
MCIVVFALALLYVCALLHFFESRSSLHCNGTCARSQAVFVKTERLLKQLFVTLRNLRAAFMDVLPQRLCVTGLFFFFPRRPTCARLPAPAFGVRASVRSGESANTTAIVAPSSRLHSAAAKTTTHFQGQCLVVRFPTPFAICRALC